MIYLNKKNSPFRMPVFLSEVCMYDRALGTKMKGKRGGVCDGLKGCCFVSDGERSCGGGKVNAVDWSFGEGLGESGKTKNPWGFLEKSW